MNVLPERHDADSHPVPLPATVLSQKNGSISGHSSSCPQTAATDLASPSRKKPLSIRRRTKTLLNFRIQNLCHDTGIPGTCVAVSIPGRFLFSDSQTVSLMQQIAQRTGIFTRTAPNVPCATLTTRFPTICVDKCDMTNGTAFLCPANVPEKTETWLPKTVPYLFSRHLTSNMHPSGRPDHL